MKHERASLLKILKLSSKYNLLGSLCCCGWFRPKLERILRNTAVWGCCCWDEVGIIFWGLGWIIGCCWVCWVGLCNTLELTFPRIFRSKSVLFCCWGCWFGVEEGCRDGCRVPKGDWFWLVAKITSFDPSPSVEITSSFPNFLKRKNKSISLLLTPL
jgi:hypothetical protein